MPNKPVRMIDSDGELQPVTLSLGNSTDEDD